MSKSIDTVFAFITEDDDGDEGVPAVATPDGWMMPLVGGDLLRMRSLRPLAQQVANDTGRPVKLCVFRQREVQDTLHPKPLKPPKGMSWEEIP